MTRHSLQSASVLSQQKPDTLMPCLAKNWGNSENIKNWQQIIQNKVVLLTHSTIWSFSSSKLIWIEITRSHNFYSKSKVQKEEEQVTIDHFASGWVRLKVFLLIFPQRKKLFWRGGWVPQSAWSLISICKPPGSYSKYSPFVQRQNYCDAPNINFSLYDASNELRIL